MPFCLKFLLLLGLTYTHASVKLVYVVWEQMYDTQLISHVTHFTWRVFLTVF